MNKIVKSILCLALVSSIACGAYAQNSPNGQRPENCKEQKKDWQERFRAEKVAYLTQELDLTAEEAQVFWPVYNQVEKERFATMKNRMNASKALKAALKEGKGEAEIDALTEAYLRADDSMQFYLDAKAQFRQVLSAEKVAKLVLAEEKFRNKQFHRLKGGDNKKGDRPQEGQQKNRKGNAKAAKAQNSK